MGWLLILFCLVVVVVALLAGVDSGRQSNPVVIRRNYTRSRQLDEQVLNTAGGFDDALQDEEQTLN